MTDMPQTPATLTAAPLSRLLATLHARLAQTAVENASYEDPFSRTCRIQAAIQRREDLRNEVHRLLR